MASSFTVVTRARLPAEALVDASLSIDEHVASMEMSGERAIGGVTHGAIGLGAPLFGRLADHVVLLPYLRRWIRQRQRHVLASFDATPGTEPALATWPVDGSTAARRSEATALIGRGDRVWRRATHDVLRWKVKTRSGFAVEDAQKVSVGSELTITARLLGITVREPVRVEEVVETDTRVGFSYRTLPGHPVRGEEAFIVHREGDDVFLTVRSLTAPSATQPWRSMYPLLRIAQTVARRRYLRALREDRHPVP